MTAYAAAMWWIFLNSPSLTGLCLIVADIYVVAGVILMVLLIVFVLKDEDLDLKKKKDE